MKIKQLTLLVLQALIFLLWLTLVLSTLRSSFSCEGSGCGVESFFILPAMFLFGFPTLIIYFISRNNFTRTITSSENEENKNWGQIKFLSKITLFSIPLPLVLVIIFAFGEIFVSVFSK